MKKNEKWEMKDWKVARSLSGYSPEFGFPIGEYLCRDEEEVKSCVEKLHDPIIENYIGKNENGR